MCKIDLGVNINQFAWQEGVTGILIRFKIADNECFTLYYFFGSHNLTRSSGNASVRPSIPGFPA